MTEQQWKASYKVYKAALPANRAAYKAARADAPIEASEFDRLVRAEVNIDLAGNNSGEWVRAAKAVSDRLWSDYDNSIEEPDSDHERQRRVEQVARDHFDRLLDGEDLWANSP